MMPYCQGINCDNVAVFLGPNENPAYCEEHLAKLMDRIHTYFQKNDRTNDPLAPNPNAEYEIENAQVEGILKEIGGQLGAKMPAGFGFNLLIFSFGEGGSMFYISNAQRQDMIESMKEFIEKQEAKK